ncbi:MAG: hypothetical protein ABI193_26675 [Minicystis sp.]
MHPPEVIAQRLATQFASTLGAELPALTEWVLAGEPAEESHYRSGDPSVVLGCASFLVALSTLAWNAYLRLTLGREVATLQSEMSFMKGLLVAELHREAPHDRRVGEPTRGLLVDAAADLALDMGVSFHERSTPIVGSQDRKGPLLGHDAILELHGAVVSAGLSGSRAALLVGIEASFVAMLRTAERPGEQILCDLGELDAVGSLAGQSVPLGIWLANAGCLAAGRREAAVFRGARARLEGAEKG